MRAEHRHQGGNGCSKGAGELAGREGARVEGWGGGGWEGRGADGAESEHSTCPPCEVRG